MPHNSISQGNRTREQQKAVINGEIDTKPIDVDPHQPSLAEARKDIEQPAGEFETVHDVDGDANAQSTGSSQKPDKAD